MNYNFNYDDDYEVLIIMTRKRRGRGMRIVTSKMEHNLTKMKLKKIKTVEKMKKLMAAGSTGDFLFPPALVKNS